MIKELWFCCGKCFRGTQDEHSQRPAIELVPRPTASATNLRNTAEEVNNTIQCDETVESPRDAVAHQLYVDVGVPAVQPDPASASDPSEPETTSSHQSRLDTATDPGKDLVNCSD